MIVPAMLETPKTLIFHSSTHYLYVGQALSPASLEVANCNLKRRPRREALFALRLNRAGRGHAL
jgi:hypothetical protein